MTKMFNKKVKKRQIIREKIWEQLIRFALDKKIISRAVKEYDVHHEWNWTEAIQKTSDAAKKLVYEKYFEAFSEDQEIREEAIEHVTFAERSLGYKYEAIGKFPLEALIVDFQPV